MSEGNGPCLETYTATGVVVVTDLIVLTTPPGLKDGQVTAPVPLAYAQPAGQAGTSPE